MSLAIIASTELEAVNVILNNIGETSVSSLEDETLVDALMARSLLTTVSRELQTKSWHWNTDLERKMLRTNKGEIVLPTNTMSVVPAGADKGLDLVQRGRRLYDRRKHTYNFTKDITVNLTVSLPFDEMPETARRFVTLRAARMFQEQTISSESLAQGDRVDEAIAYSTLMTEHLRVAGYSMLNGSNTTRSVTWRQGV